MSSTCFKCKLFVTAVKKTKVSKKQDEYVDEEDGVAIFAGFEAYLAAHPEIEQTIQTDLDDKKKRNLKAKALDKPHIIYFLIDDLGKLICFSIYFLES